MKISTLFFILSMVLIGTTADAATVTTGGLTVTDGAYLEKAEEQVITQIEVNEIIAEDVIKSPIMISEDTYSLTAGAKKPLVISDVYVVIKKFIHVFAA